MATINQNLRDKLFPGGMPEPDEFIRVLANYILEQRLVDMTVGKSQSQNKASADHDPVIH